MTKPWYTKSWDENGLDGKSRYFIENPKCHERKSQGTTKVRRVHSLGTTNSYSNPPNRFLRYFPVDQRPKYWTNIQTSFLTLMFLLLLPNKICPVLTVWFTGGYSLCIFCLYLSLERSWLLNFHSSSEENSLTCELNLSWQTLQETCFLFAVGGMPRVWWRTAFCTGSIWGDGERRTERLIKTVLEADL